MKTILIVDDQPEVRELVEVTLRSDDYRILTEANGENAVKTALAEHPDVIIMDVMMPGSIDGFQATERIRSDPTMAGCPIIMLTARGQQADRERGLKAGATDYLTKPFSPLELMTKIEQILDG